MTLQWDQSPHRLWPVLTIWSLAGSTVHFTVETGISTFFVDNTTFCLTNRKPCSIFGLTLTMEKIMGKFFDQLNLFGGIDSPLPNKSVTRHPTVSDEMVFDVLKDILPPAVVEAIASGKQTLVVFDITPPNQSQLSSPAKTEQPDGLGFMASDREDPEDGKSSGD